MIESKAFLPYLLFYLPLDLSSFCRHIISSSSFYRASLTMKVNKVRRQKMYDANRSYEGIDTLSAMLSLCFNLRARIQCLCACLCRAWVPGPFKVHASRQNLNEHKIRH